MKIKMCLPSILLLTSAFHAHAAEPFASVEPLTPAQSQRLLVMGTAVGELVYAFGYGDSVVARDISCEFPEAIQAKPAIGYFRQVAAEGVLSMQPSAILSTEAAGPPNVIQQLKASGLPVHLFSDEPDLDTLRNKIWKMGALFDAPERAGELVEKLDNELAAIPQREAEPASVLFLLSPPGSDRLLAAGSGTAADAMIRLAGGKNAFADLRGFRPIASELIAARRPEIVLMPSSAEAASYNLSVGNTAIDRLVEQGHTRIVRIDLAETLAFGIRTGEAAANLHSAMYE